MDEDYGPCCICESKKGVRNIIQLDYKVVSESGWGCVQCELSPEGAVAIVCDSCIEQYGSDNIEDKIIYLMDRMHRRIVVPPAEGRILHKHDLSRHPELEFDSFL